MADRTIIHRMTQLLIRAAEIVLSIGLAFVLSTAAVGVPLAIAGKFTPPIAGTAIIIITIVFSVLLIRMRLAQHIPTSLTVAIGLAIIVLVGLFYAALPGQHYAINRDPGAYTVEARYLAKNGTLLVDGPTGPFRDAGLSANGYGIYDTHRSDGKFYTQFAHLTASVLAVANWVGGPRLMVRMNAIVTTIGLIAFLLLLLRFVRPITAVILTTAMSLTLPFVWFTRDTYSEPLTFLLLMSGVLLSTHALAATQKRTVAFFFGGMAIGATFATRIDGIVILAAFSGLAFIAAFDRSIAKREVLAAIGGAGVMALIATLDLRWRSPVYLHDLKSNVQYMAYIAITMTVLSLLALGIRNQVTRFSSWFGKHAKLFFAVGGIFLVLILAYSYLARPQLGPTVSDSGKSPLVEVLQAHEGLPIDGFSREADTTTVQISWYTGALVVLLGMVGAGIMASRIPVDKRLAIPIVILLFPTLVYLWFPAITPDQIWAMRRFVPAAIPFFYLATAICIEEIISRINSRTGEFVGIGISAAILVTPLATIIPLYDAREIKFSQVTARSLCNMIGSDAAVAIFPDTEVGNQLPQVIQTECEVPVAKVKRTTDLNALANQWAKQNKRLVVLTTPEETPPGLPRIGSLIQETQDLEHTISRAPTEQVHEKAALVLFSVPTT